MPHSKLRDFDIVILSIVRRKPQYGYDLVKSEELSELCGKVTNSQIYYSLSKLKSLGYITEKAVPSFKAPDRKLMKLTVQGRHFLDIGFPLLLRRLRDDSATLWQDYSRRQADVRSLFQLKHRLSSDTLSRTQS